MNAIDYQYIAAIVNCISQDIQLDILQIFDYLFKTYGKVTPVAFKTRRTDVLESGYDVFKTIDTLFSNIDNLCDMAEKVGLTIIQPQCINIAYVLLVKTRKFSATIREWNHWSAIKKTWINFKNHFCEVQNELEDLEELQESY
mmetsp:Transcript_13708/g.19593  ORF Transcript_13708/g.19593 Transcript_13708/m.19593 type:complete len:143 (-) Transcript_13708:677-1105(-)